MAVLSFIQMQNMVLKNAFPESDRTDAKTWIIDAHEELWGAADYTFKNVVATTVTVVNGILTGVSDVDDVYALYDGNGDPLTGYYDPARFYERYNSAASTASSQAEAFLVIGTSIVVKPSTTGTMTGFQITYRKTKPSLVNDADTTGFPDGYDMGVVCGAKATGFTLINNPFADDFNAVKQRIKQQLHDRFTYGLDESGLQVPPYRPVT